MTREPGAGSSLGVLAGVLAAIGVGAGAFGAHALRGRLDAGALATFETAVRYHLIHAIAAVLAADRAERSSNPLSRRAAVLFALGIVLFSGSLYALALGGPRLLGAITPLGGLAFIIGWLLLALSFSRR